MKNFEFFTPTKVVFGRGVTDRAGELCAAFGAHKVLIHYGGSHAVKSGLIDRVKKSLDAAGVAHVELGGVVPNPHLGKVREGIELARAEGVDFILAVGGGSTIDSSKAIAYALAEPESDVWELYAHVRRAKATFPVGAVLTIAAAGSEMSNSSVITDERTGAKRSYNDDISRPKFAVMDPELTVSLPDYQTESGCADIMMHTMERWFSREGQMDLTDALAAGLIQTVMRDAEILHAVPSISDARSDVLWASSLSHNGLTGCGGDGGDWACHRIEHELGGMFDVTHGAGLAAVWGTWARFVMKNALPRFVKFATFVMGCAPAATDEETALRGIEAMEAFYRRIGMPTNLRELGLTPTDEQIAAMAKSCAEAVGGKIGSAMELHEPEMAEIYRRAR